MLRFIEQNWQNLLWSAGILVGAIAISLVLRWLVLWGLRRLTRRKGTLLGQSFVRHGERPTHWIFPLLAVLTVLPGLPLPHILMSALEHIAGLGLIAAVAWLATLQLRALMDARNSGEAWDLRCMVREKLVDFLQRNDPQSLPRYRGKFEMP